MHKYIMKFMQ